MWEEMDVKVQSVPETFWMHFRQTATRCAIQRHKYIGKKKLGQVVENEFKILVARVGDLENWRGWYEKTLESVGIINRRLRNVGAERAEMQPGRQE